MVLALTGAFLLVAARQLPIEVTVERNSCPCLTMSTS